MLDSIKRINDSNAPPKWLDAHARKWLEQILFERFGHVFRIEVSGADRTRLRLEGHGAAIFIRVHGDDSFSRASSVLLHDEWHAHGQGWGTAVSGPLPAPGADRLPVPLILQCKEGMLIQYDILGLMFWTLSRQEEVARTDLDEHGRFPAASSHAFKHGYLERPVVDEWLNILGQVIERTWPSITMKAHRFKVQVSHDVDTPSRYAFRSSLGFLKAMAGDALIYHNPRSALMAPWIRQSSRNQLHRHDPVNTFEWIMGVSEQLQLKSAFYFICGRTDVAKDADYELEHPAIRKLLSSIAGRGHEIGLHPSYGTCERPELLKAEAIRLKRVVKEQGIEQSAWGGRMHYLRWKQPQTLQAWKYAGMDYDSTLGYADQAGFRCGTCYEYPAFDPVAMEQLDLRIRPLIAMECTVLDHKYMGLGCGEVALAKFLKLKQTCRAVNGVFSLLWHNSQLVEQSEKNLYQAILQPTV